MGSGRSDTEQDPKLRSRGRQKRRVRSMNSDSNASSPTIEAQARKLLRWRPGSLKYILAVTILACSFGAALLAFAFPTLSEQLFKVTLVCFLVLFVGFLRALFRRRWRELAIYLVIWFVVLLPHKFGASRWLYVEAFRVHASPIEEYLSRCELFEFVENDKKQVLGWCELGAVGNEVARQIFYDTTEEFGLPVSQRTPEWKAVMGKYDPVGLLTKKEGRGTKLIEHFYEVIIPGEEWDSYNWR
jgi:hypothetical protein